ncbi:MAG: fumarylacetoacetate hydrolase family protein [Alistipes sp.]|jgi:2-keto-4-pentenoate hydratase/2-oxohepta-3-ene-1,7-dioic acid hydratase in catechol pathway|nr:fumarylacetoacetate hydrolase family protein [Alistipes sp.]
MKLINIINSYTSEEQPRYYLKADTALLRNNDAFYIPDGVGAFVAAPHIVLRVSRLAKCIGERFAPRCIDAVMAGVTFTASERLEQLRAAGLPWDEAVGFDHSSALSLDMLGRDAMLEGATFYINDEPRLQLSVADMAFTPDRIVSHLSEMMTLRIGDLIYLGSSEHFPVKVGDNYKVVIAGRTLLNFDIK